MFFYFVKNKKRKKKCIEEQEKRREQAQKLNKTYVVCPYYNKKVQKVALSLPKEGKSTLAF